MTGDGTETRTEGWYWVKVKSFHAPEPYWTPAKWGNAGSWWIIAGLDYVSDAEYISEIRCSIPTPED